MTLIERALLRMRAGRHQGGYINDEGTFICLEGALIMAQLDEDFELEGAGRFRPLEVFFSQDKHMDQVHPAFTHARDGDRMKLIRNAILDVAAEQFPQCIFGSLAEFNDHSTDEDVEMVCQKAAAILPADVLE